MGIFDDIMAPLKDLIRSLTKPIHVVESIFGKIIDLTEDLISQIESMIEDMRKLFDAHQIEQLFLYPFKEAAFTAISSVDKIYSLISSASAPTVDGVKDDLKESLDAVYTMMHNAADDVISTFHDIVTRIDDDETNFGHSINTDFTRIKALVEEIPAEIMNLSRRIKSELVVVSEDAFAHIPDFPEMITNAGSNAFSTVRRVGATTGADFTSFEASLSRRIGNEHAALDAFYLFVAGGIVAMLVAIFLITKSIVAIVAIIVLILVSIVVFAVIDLLIGSISVSGSASG